MNGPHDLGGAMGFGPINPEADEPVFHAPWEARALGLTLAAGALGAWSLDESRHARETLPWPVYLGSSYYRIWITALEALLLRHGLVSAAELDSGTAEAGPAHGRRLTADRVAGALARGGPCDREIGASPAFTQGQMVRVRNRHMHGHTRIPGYARGKRGQVIAVHGGFVLPDASAHGRRDLAERLYTVEFDGAELWGPDAEPGSRVTIDAWESYLDRA